MANEESNLRDKAQKAKETTKDVARKAGAAAKGAVEGFREQSEKVDLKGEAKRSGEWAKDAAQKVTSETGKQVRETADVVKKPEQAEE
jgi:hypothetical protein